MNHAILIGALSEIISPGAARAERLHARANISGTHLKWRPLDGN